MDELTMNVLSRLDVRVGALDMLIKALIKEQQTTNALLKKLVGESDD